MIDLDFSAGERLVKVFGSQEIKGVSMRFLIVRRRADCYELHAIMEGPSGKHIAHKVFADERSCLFWVHESMAVLSDLGFEFLEHDLTSVVTWEEFVAAIKERGWDRGCVYP